MNVPFGDGSDFDELLERELHKHVADLNGPSPVVAQSSYQHAFATGGSTRSHLSSFAAAASSKAAAAFALAALAAAGGAVVATAATGSPNPAVWGSTVTKAVTSCRNDLTAGQHGIGQCVSNVARKNGVDQTADHLQAASSARTDHPTGKPSGLPSGAQNSAPSGSGKPKGVPVGPPTTLPAASDGSHPTGAPVSRPPHR